MDMLKDLLSGDQRRTTDDFVRRYDQGAPWDGIGDDEALEQYQRIAPALSDDRYVESAKEAFSRLAPEQRAEFGRWLHTEAERGGTTLTDLDGDGIQDAGTLAGATNQVRHQQPGLLEGLLGGAMGGGSGGLLSSPIAKAALAGIAAVAVSKVMGGR